MICLMSTRLLEWTFELLVLNFQHKLIKSSAESLKVKREENKLS